MAAVLVGMSVAVGLSRLSIGVDLGESLLARDPLDQANGLVEDHLAGMDAFRLPLRADEVDRLKDPDVIAAVNALQQRLEEREGVDATLSYVDLIVAIYDALDPDRSEQLPARRGLVGQLVMLFGSPQTMAPFVTADWDQAAVTVRSTVGGGAALRKLTGDVEEIAAEVLPADLGCTLQGELLLESQGNDAAGRAMLRHASRALIGALALCMIVIRRVSPFLRLVVPLTLVTVAALGAANLGAPSLAPVTLSIPWIGLAAGLPVALFRARVGRPRSRDWLAVAVVGACFAPLMASSLRFDAAVGIGVALGAGVAALCLWGDGGVEEE